MADSKVRDGRSLSRRQAIGLAGAVGGAAVGDCVRTGGAGSV